MAMTEVECYMTEGLIVPLMHSRGMYLVRVGPVIG
jgi:hypothetical protein